MKLSYSNYNFQEQLNFYSMLGFKDQIWLWEGGVIARNHSDSKINLGKKWFL